MDSSLHDSYLSKLIDEGASHLGTINSYCVSCTQMQISDCFTAELPDFCEEFIMGRFTSTGCSCGCSSTGVTIEDGETSATSITSTCSCAVWYYSPNVLTGLPAYCAPYGQYFAIQGNTITFPSTTTATSFQAYYKSMNVDDNGFMILYERWERGLSAYAASQFALDYPERYSPEQRRGWHLEWVAQKGKQKAKSVADQNKLDKAAVMNIMNAIVLNNYAVAGFGTPGFT